MRLLIVSEGNKLDFANVSSYLNSEVELLSPLSLSELERLPLDVDKDVMLLSVTTFARKELAFLQRLIAFSAIPLLINAQSWQADDLKSLLTCGRVTFVPGQLEMSRLNDLLVLAKLRYELAEQQLQEISTLQGCLEEQKQLAKVKSKLQAKGLSESQAHQLLQKEAMKQGLPLAQLVKQFL
ncbi:response regulator NasT [Shewanella nanhaiensis]|uniref:Response regulator NasT n=1 Tax=Shewanella nanhaiensis TaxID=2864872 RepID=A0ABS7E213_9GAMM|nr:response regulator NasT [Shewanella nanhaiensis]MBW8183744.1 response regulator NasT [Shewanella nanhaiensis]